MYIAKTLGQTSLIISNFNFSYDSGLHAGSWEFLVKECFRKNQGLDPRDFDCDYGSHSFTLNIVEVCLTPDASLYLECQSAPPPDPDPVDPNTDPGDTSPYQSNQKPFFIDFEHFQIYEVTRNKELSLQLPEVFDKDEEDIVNLTVRLTREMQDWIDFDSKSRRFFLHPNKKTTPGVTLVKVFLDDSKDKNEYFLSFLVLEEDKKNQKDSEVPLKEEEDKQVNLDDDSEEPENKKLSNDTQPTQDPSKIKNFDSITLQAVNDLKKLVKEKEPVIFPNEDQQEPQVIINSINGNGEVSIKFNQEMNLSEIFDHYTFLSKVSAQNEDAEDSSLLRLLEGKQIIDLASLISAQILRGDQEKSASSSKLRLQMELVNYSSETTIQLKFKFENPLSISIGDQPDILMIKIEEPDLFVSKKTRKALRPGIYITKPIPKQFLNEAFFKISVVTSDTVQAAANTAFLSQVLVTICLAVSLKAMWNLHHVIQVLAYFRILIDWPANSLMMLQSMHNAITLDNLLNGIYDTQFDDFVQKDEVEIAKDQKLKKFDISYKNLYFSLGIFGILLGLLLFVLLLYFLVKLISVKVKCCEIVLKFLKAKLFYNVYIRYLITSYLKLTHNCVIFLYISGSFELLEDQINTGLRIVLLAIIVIWPFFLACFLNCNKHRLENVDFKQKFWSMYTGINIKRFSAFAYTSVFCLRRILLVCLFMALHNQTIWLILSLNALQSFYFWYLTSVMPHEETIHNRLEILNELCIIAMQYLMIFLINGSGIDPEVQWNVGTATMALVGFVFLVNFTFLIYLTINRLLFVLRVKKAKKAKMIEMARRNESKKLKFERDELNNARDLSQIKEEVESEDSMMRQLGSIRLKRPDDNEIRENIPLKPPTLLIRQIANLNVEESQLFASSEQEEQSFASVNIPTLYIETSVSKRNERCDTKLSLGGAQTELGFSSADNRFNQDQNTNSLLTWKKPGTVNFKERLYLHEIEAEQDSANDVDVLQASEVTSRDPVSSHTDLQSSVLKIEKSTGIIDQNSSIDLEQIGIKSAVQRSLTTKIKQIKKFEVEQGRNELFDVNLQQRQTFHQLQKSDKVIISNLGIHLTDIDRPPIEEEKYPNGSPFAWSPRGDDPKKGSVWAMYNKTKDTPLQSLQKNSARMQPEAKTAFEEHNRMISNQMINGPFASNTPSGLETPRNCNSTSRNAETNIDSAKKRLTIAERQNSLVQFLQAGRLVIQNTFQGKRGNNKVGTESSIYSRNILSPIQVAPLNNFVQGSTYRSSNVVRQNDFTEATVPYHIHHLPLIQRERTEVIAITEEQAPGREYPGDSQRGGPLPVSVEQETEDRKSVLSNEQGSSN